MDKKIFILLIVLNSCLLAAGIVMIFTNCSIYGNWWPLLSILVFLVGLVPPILCNAYQFGFDKTDSILFDNTSDAELGGILSWLLTGCFITIGYSIPVELFRTNLLPWIPMWLTVGGGSIILIAIALFRQLLVSNHGYNNSLNLFP
mgnify:FL=1